MNYRSSEVWPKLTGRLLPGTLVRYWRADEGYTGGAFTIEDSDRNFITVSDVLGKARRVGRRELEDLFCLWPSYAEAGINYHQLTRRSDNASFILSILHWFETSQHTETSKFSIYLTKAPTLASTGDGLQSHDQYGRQVLYDATEGRASLFGSPLEIDYGSGPPAHVAATVGDIAIQIEPRISKQVRGAILDLVCHPFLKKLLVLVPVSITSPGISAEQCRQILARFCPRKAFRVVTLKGSGHRPDLEDSAILAAVLADLAHTDLC